MLQADPEKYYHVFTAGHFPTWDWERCEWTTFEIKAEYVKSISDCYDPGVHKAPLWIGHPWVSGAPSEGWVARSAFDTSMLFNSFDYIDENFVKAVREKKYQYVSCEFGRVMGIDNDYQLALGATNLPRVSGQKPLEFEGQKFSMAKGHSVYAPVSERFVSDITKDFTASSKKYFFQNQNNKSMLNEFLTRLALAFAIDLSKHESDESLTTAISEKYSSLKTEKTVLETEVNSLKDERVKFALDQAITEGKLKPADRDSYESLLKGNFEAATKVLSSLPIDPVFKKNAVPSGGTNIDDNTNGTDKFTNVDGTQLTYEQVIEKIAADPSFAKKFTDEELTKLPGAEKYYRK